LLNKFGHNTLKEKYVTLSFAAVIQITGPEHLQFKCNQQYGIGRYTVGKYSKYSTLNTEIEWPENYRESELLDMDKTRRLCRVFK
jgi:hypothetical protein